MTAHQHTPKFLRQRKMLVVLPLLVIPFLTMAFWGLDGGKQNNGEAAPGQEAGLNIKLPSVDLPEDGFQNKLSFYEKADADSVRRNDQLLSDPYYLDSLQRLDKRGDSPPYLFDSNPNKTFESRYNDANNLALNEQKAYSRINQLNQQINEADNEPKSITLKRDYGIGEPSDAHLSQNLDRMQGLMNMINEDSESGAGMLELNSTLDKILDIQHPQRISDRTQRMSAERREEAFVAETLQPAGISLLDTGKISDEDLSDDFFSADQGSLAAQQNTILAMIQEDQTITSGSIIRMRLLNDLFISGKLIPRGERLYGVANLNGERIDVAISSVKSGESLFPVKLRAYDLDGMPGLYIPGSVERSASKNEVEKTLQSDPLTYLNPSLKLQAASAGVNAAKNIITKRMKQDKAFVKRGYRILLRNEN